MLFTDAALFDHIYVLVNQLYRMKALWLSMRKQENVQNMKNAICSGQATGDGVDGDECGGAGLKKLATSGKERRTSGAKWDSFVARRDGEGY